MPYRAGAAYASVLPDFRGFQKAIGAELKKSEPLFEKAGADDGRRFAAGFKDALRTERPQIRVDADTESARRKIDEVARDRKVKLKVETEFLRSPLTLGALGGLALGPQALGLGLAGAGLGVAGAAGAAGLVASLAIAKPMITAITTAQKNLTTAQLAYNKAAEDKKLATTKAQSLAASKAEAKALLAQKAAVAGLTPEERKLATELSGLEKAWKRVQLAEQPAVGRALLPWLQTARQDARLVEPVITDVSNAVELLGNETRAALSSPFWGKFAKTFGATGEIAVQGFGEAVGHVADGIAHLFTTFAPDIDKLPILVDKAAIAFDKWGTSVHRGGLDAFLKKTFSHGNLGLLKSDLKALDTTLGNIGKATSQLSPSAFLGLSKVLTILSKLTPDQITALGALYGVSKLTGGLPGKLLGAAGGAIGSAVLGSAVGQAVTGALKTGLGSVLSTLGLKGIAGKITGAADGLKTAGEGLKTAGAGLGTADAGLAADDAGLAADDAGLGGAAAALGGAAAALGGAAAALGGAAAALGGVGIAKGIGSLLSHLHIPGISSLLGGSSSQTVNVKVNLPKVSFKPMAASFRKDVEGPVGAWFASLPGTAAKYGAAAGRALANGIGSQKRPAASAGHGILGVVKAAFDPRALLGAGERVIGGFISGVESRFSDVESVFHKLTSLIPSWKGPAPVDAVLLTPAGILIMKSLAAGLNKGYNFVEKTLKAVAPKIAGEYASLIKTVEAQVKAKTGNPAGALLAEATVKADTARLSKLAYEYNQVAAKIAAAKQFAATTASNVTSTFGIGAAGAPNAAGKVTVGGIKANLSRYLHQIRAFGHNISILGKRGLNKAYLAQLVGLGPDQGGPIAAALATATDAQLGQVNSAEFQISKSAGQLGKLSANLLYDTGPAFGKSLFSGLKGEEKHLKAEMRDLAQVFVTTVVSELKLPGVHIPVQGGDGGLAVKLTYDGPAQGPVYEIIKDIRAVVVNNYGGDAQKALGHGKART